MGSFLGDRKELTVKTSGRDWGWKTSTKALRWMEHGLTCSRS